jgi:hypothetical protein
VVEIDKLGVVVAERNPIRVMIGNQSWTTPISYLHLHHLSVRTDRFELTCVTNVCPGKHKLTCLKSKTS